jgi:uncharacterized iron-regulated membrane protein
MKQKFSFRKFFTDIHLWLGLASGLVLFVVCLTGTILTFEHEIVEWADAEKYHAEASAGTERISVDKLVSDLEQKLKGKVQSVEIPKERGAVYRFAIQPEPGDKDGKEAATAKNEKRGDSDKADKGGHVEKLEKRGERGSENAGKGKKGAEGGGGRGGKTYLVNPYTGEVTGTTESSTAEFFSVVMGLHRWLLVQDGGGKIIVGIATLMFVFLCITGLFIWWPVKARDWKRGFKIKFSANWKRINHDLHNTLGFYALIFLLIMSLTGLCWSFSWYRSGLSALLKDEVFKQRREKPLASDPANAANATGKISLDGLLIQTGKLLPYEGNYRVRFPQDSAGSFVINKSRSGFMVLTAADKVQFEQYSGALLKLEKFSDKPANEQVASSVRSLHLGDIYGTLSKIIYFIACLFATSLPVTGTIIWLNKLKKKRRARRHQPQPFGV